MQHTAITVLGTTNSESVAFKRRLFDTMQQPVFPETGLEADTLSYIISAAGTVSDFRLRNTKERLASFTFRV